MRKYFIILAIFVLFLGCGRVGSESDSIGTLSQDASGKKDFDIILNSRYLQDSNSFIKQGHYSLLFKYSGNPSTALEGVLFENGSEFSSSESGEATVVIDPSTNSITNNILLLLDFSGSIINDYSSQLTTSVISFIEGVEQSKVKIAIYYLNSKKIITPIVAEPMDSVGLKMTIENLLTDAYFSRIIQENLVSTNLYGATIEAIETACKWVGNCNSDTFSEQPTLETDNFEFASVVVFTDGRDQAGWVKESEMLTAIKNNKALFYQGVGVGKDVDKELIEAISTDQGIYEEELNTQSIESAFDKLTIWANSFYEASYCPADQLGTVDIKIEVEDKGSLIGTIQEKGVKLINSEEFRCDLP